MFTVAEELCPRNRPPAQGWIAIDFWVLPEQRDEWGLAVLNVVPAHLLKNCWGIAHPITAWILLHPFLLSGSFLALPPSFPSLELSEKAAAHGGRSSARSRLSRAVGYTLPLVACSGRCRRAQVRGGTPALAPTSPALVSITELPPFQ